MPYFRAQADRRLQQRECLAVLTGRGALTRPWLFEEWRTKQELFPTAAERVGIFRCNLALATCEWSPLSLISHPAMAYRVASVATSACPSWLCAGGWCLI